jgi:predicted phage terminase large subunit-like protein
MQNPMYRRSKHSALTSWATDMKLWDEWEAIVTDKSLDNEAALQNGKLFYESNREAMDEGGGSSWPEVYSYYELMLIRASEGHTAFATELLNDPADPSTALFKEFKRFKSEIRLAGTLYETWLVPLTGQAAVRMQDCALFGFTDPSLGRNLASDFSAIIILARAPHGLMFVVQCDIVRRSPDATIQAQNAWAQKLNIARWGIETNQFQAFYFTQSGASARSSGISLPLVPVNQTKNKEIRIQSLEPDINNGWILFPEHGAELLIEQLSWYGFTTHDDGPDALEGARTLALRWEGMQSVQVAQGEGYTFGDLERDPSRPEDPWADHDDRALAVLEDRAIDLELDLVEASSDAERAVIQSNLDQVQTAIEAEHKGVFVPYIIFGR